jgi:hypothetical protein
MVTYQTILVILTEPSRYAERTDLNVLRYIQLRLTHPLQLLTNKLFSGTLCTNIDIFSDSTSSTTNLFAHNYFL